jgi:hypothetical protein
MSDKKAPERIWIDPPGIEPEISLEELGKPYEWEGSPPLPQNLTISENIFRRWRLMFIGLLYLFTGVAIQIAVEFGITIDMIQSIFIGVGFLFISMAMLIYKKNGERRF